MRCTFKYLHIEEKGEIITPISATFIFKPIHPLWLCLIKIIPLKNFALDLLQQAKQSLPPVAKEQIVQDRSLGCAAGS